MPKTKIFLKEMPLSLPYDDGPVPKIMLTWGEHKQFSSVNPDVSEVVNLGVFFLLIH